MNPEQLKQYFYDPNENLIAVLGQGYITSLLQGHLSRSIMFLTNKRLYQKGKTFSVTPNGKFISMKGESSCEVKDIHGTSFKEFNRTPILIASILFTTLAIIFFIIAGERRASEGLSTLASFSTTFSLFLWIFYFILRRRIFMVHISGGNMATDARWYSEQELHNFAKAISLTKESLEKK